jgi:hypothetical protein
VKNPYQSFEEWLQSYEGKTGKQPRKANPPIAQANPLKPPGIADVKPLKLRWIVGVVCAAFAVMVFNAEPAKTVRPEMPQVGDMVRLTSPALGCPTSGHVLAFADFVVANEHTDKSLWTLISEWHAYKQRTCVPIEASESGVIEDTKRYGNSKSEAVCVELRNQPTCLWFRSEDFTVTTKTAKGKL